MFLGLSMLILMMAFVVNKGKISVRIGRYHIWSVAFAGFAVVSGLWATYSFSASLASASLLFLTFICAAMVYIYYQDRMDASTLFSAVMWSGYVVAIYTLIYYGYDTLTQMAVESSERMENEYANVNNIGMMAALSCVLQVNALFNKRNRWSAIMMIPAVIVIAATQSRKAFVMLIGGALVVALLKSLQSKNKGKALLRFVAVTVVAILALRYLLELPIFGGVLERMEGLLENLSGAGEGGASSAMRARMRELGWELFLEHPIAGVGLNNPQYFAAVRLMFQSYLHNNYVEILAAGGTLGFLLYYSAHAYILINLFKYRKADPNAFIMGIVWMGIILVMDYGMVSYTDKSHIFYMMIQFLNVEIMKRKYRSMNYGSEKIH